MKAKRVVQPYKTYILHADGTRERIDAHGLIIELRRGIEVETALAAPSTFAGQLVLFASPMASMERLYDEGKVDDFTVLFGGANVLHVMVDRRTKQPASPKATVAATKPTRRRKSKS